jgi:hypothetical protein
MSTTFADLGLAAASGRGPARLAKDHGNQEPEPRAGGKARARRIKKTSN